MPKPQPPLSERQQQRYAYLHAMGVPLWVHRQLTPKITRDQQPVTDAIHPAKSLQTSHEALITNTKKAVEDLSAALSVSPSTKPSITPVTTPIPTAPAATSTLEPINCLDSTWGVLSTQISHCQSCSLHQSRHQAVQGSGNQSAECLIIGDTPELEDDRKGHPFMGKSGQLLTNMLSAIDLPRNTVYLTQTTKCRAPNDRMPSPTELTQCSHYLYRQIELINPEKILILGRTAAQFLLQQKAPLSTFRGTVHTLPKANVPTVVTYHPRILLKNPNDKRKAWEDLKLFKSLTP